MQEQREMQPSDGPATPACAASDPGHAWASRPTHRRWLRSKAEALLTQFQHSSIDPAGGFFDLDIAGQPRRETGLRELVTTTRVTHCFAIAHLLGWPGAEILVRHGLAALWNLHRDARNGGYHWQSGPGADSSKQAYGHAFVLLAASSARMAGFLEADRILADVTDVLNSRFWEAHHGATAEEFSAEWQPISDYRGQNANMHLTEALMAAYEATGERAYLDKAQSIADLVINRIARAHQWHVIEHFNQNWQPDTTYRGSDMFRPQGTTPGHALEWSRLVAQLHVLSGETSGWMPEAADGLFRQAVADGWDARDGGFYYTLDYNNAPLIRDRLWWPCCEAVAAAAFLSQRRGGDAFYEGWYRRIWSWISQNLADPVHGGWYPELDDSLHPRPRFFTGKPDIYHLLQSFLIPLYAADGSLGEMVRRAATQGA